jgi:hypothetical protein
MRADLRPGFLILGVGMTGNFTSSRLDDDLDTLLFESDLTDSGTRATRFSPSADSLGTPIFMDKADSDYGN